MGSISAAELDASLCAGGLAVAASDRAARAILAAYHRARRAEGRQAWLAPRVLDWQTFVREEWESRSHDGRLVLNALQEQSVWEDVIGRSGHAATLLESPRRNLARMAMHAHSLLSTQAPRFLDERTRAGWQDDASVFSQWMSAFEDRCREQRLVSASRLPLELIPLLESAITPRSPLLLAAFDRLLPAQQALFDAWGPWSQPKADEPARSVHFYSAADAQNEIGACAAWCAQRLAAKPDTRLLVISQDTLKRRGELERAFLRAGVRCEFSLGIPLGAVPLARAAFLLLRWLDGRLDENELDWLFASGYAASEEESAALQSAMRFLRKRGLQRPQWSLRAFLEASSRLPAAWSQKMAALDHRLRDNTPREFTALEWCDLADQFLNAAGWPAARSLSSVDYQAANRWRHTLDLCGSLAFNAARMTFRAFLAELRSALDSTLFAPQSQDAPVLVAGPVESAGLVANAIWFLGAGEDAWPAHGDMHPLLPPDVQRNARMPHASAQIDWDLAYAVTARLLASAPEITFSYARQDAGADVRPSRLILHFAGAPLPMPPEFIPVAAPPPITEPFEDFSRIPLAGNANAMIQSAGDAIPQDAEEDAGIAIAGGAGVLTSQSQCPFKAFATVRLAAHGWETAEPGLTAADRGQLLHTVMSSVWSGKPNGIRTLDDLLSLPDLRAFAAGHVHSVLAVKIPSRAHVEMPPRYLELEQRRLTRLVTEWLEYERTRIHFTVEETETDETRTIAGLTLKLRLDRLDRLNDDTFLVIDYKTGNVSPRLWDLPRPDDIQLPLYAGFGLAQGQLAGGLVFAKVRPGEMKFEGSVGDARSNLFANLNGTSSLVKNPMGAEQIADWHDKIEELARNFLAGRADVDPRDPPNTCEHCGLQTLCRIHESMVEDDVDDADEENGDE